MSTSQKLKQPSQRNKQSTESVKTTKTSLRRWKGALIGCLMICVAAISGCVSKSSPLPDAPQVTVDASLLVEPNLTMQLVNALSE